MSEFDGVVIGGGPAGMLAAITAAERGAEYFFWNAMTAWAESCELPEKAGAM